MQYKAEIRHSENTIKAMAAAQYEVFRPSSYYIMLVAGMLLLVAGLTVPFRSQSARILLLMIGSFVLVGLDAPARQLAAQVIKSLNGRYPNMNYVFGNDRVQLTGSDAGSSLGYGEIIRLHEDSRYLYIFIENRSAYMLERSSISPDYEGLKSFLTEKTGLTWSAKRSVLNTSLTSIINSRKNTAGQPRGNRLDDRH